MTDKYLVANASRAGSTAGVAEAIGAELMKDGAQVDVWPVDVVDAITRYDAVVLGSAVQGSEVLPEALDFVQRYQSALQQRPFAAFLVCITLAMKKGDEYRPHVDKWLDPVRSLVRPVSTEVFAGALDIGKVPGFGKRLGFRLGSLFGFTPEGDHRDWEAVTAWATKLRSLLEG